MSFTLSQCLVSLYGKLGERNTSRATGGSTTTIVDSALAEVGADDDWKDGVAIVIRDAGGAGAAPEGEFSRISGSTDGTGTFTLASTLTAAVASGDDYMVASSLYPLRDMIQCVNDGLRALGDIPLVDTTTLDTVAGQTQYTASVAWTRRPPIRIERQGRTGASTDNQPEEVENWEYRPPSSSGGTGLITFKDYLVAGRDLYIYYVDAHEALSAFSDKINAVITPELAIKAALVEALTWRNNRDGGSDDAIKLELNRAMQELANAKVEWKPWKPRRDAKIFTFGSFSQSADEFTTPSA